MIKCLRPIYIPLLFLSMGALSWSQTDRASVTGTISDPSGSPVSNATVTATSLATGLKRTATTSDAGAYTMTALPIGSWTVSVAAAGFETLEFAAFELEVGQTRTLDARLTVGAVQSRVEVNAEAPLVQTSAVVGGVITGSQIQNLPVNGRNWASLMALVPGGVDTGVDDEKSVRFAGRATDDNNFRFDGVDATGIQNQGQRTSTRLQMSTEAIAEFRVVSSLYTAETGGSAGGQVEIVSKTGSNTPHGSVFEFLRNSYFDARSFDSKTPSLPPFRLNQYGGSFGGAIVKDKTFFFVNYEGFRQTLGQPLTGAVPSPAYRAATLAKSPALKPILDAYPDGTVPTSDKNVYTWFGNGTQTAQEDAGLFRIDQRIDDKTTAFVRFNMDSGVADAPLGASGLFLRDRLGTTIKPYNAIISVQRVFSPRILNDIKVGFNRSDFLTVNESILPFAVTVPSFTTLNNSIAKIAVSNSFSFLDNATFVFGRSTIKFGVETRRVQINQSATATDDFTVAYASAADFTNNVVSSATLNSAVPLTGLRKTSAFGYVQDEYKFRPNLTLNIGLRYEFFGVFSEVNNHYVAFDPKSCPAGFCPAGSDFYFPDLGDFSPRVSFAWSPLAMHGKTVVRSGYGNYYGEAQLGDLNAPVNNIATRLALTSAGTPGLTYPVAPFLASATNSLTPRGLDRHRVNQNVASWGLSVQHEVMPETVFEIGYLGTKGTHLFTRSGINAVNIYTGVRQFPALGLVDYKTSDANSTFHALQISLKRNFSRGLLIQANYQWSHSINDGTVGGGEALAPENLGCRACERGSSDQDIRQVLTASAVYLLPFGQGRKFASDIHGFLGTLISGWGLSGIGTARTGRPVNILITRKTTDLLDQNNTNQRPDYVAGISPVSSPQTVQSWLNLAAYATPAKNAWGNLGKNTARGPGLWQIDPALTKDTKLNERMNLQFRAEFFNILNRAQYGDPINSVSNTAQFGQILAPINTGATGSGTPRQLQFMLRLAF